jgi:hypothetical protein
MNKFLKNYTPPKTSLEEGVTTSYGMPNTNAFINSGTGSTNFSTDQLLKNYEIDTRNQYFGSQKTPLVNDLYQSKLDKTFMGFPSYRQQELTGPDMGEYIGSGTDIPLEFTTAGKIQSGLEKTKDATSGIMSNIKGFGPISFALGAVDKFGTLPTADQEFIKMNMGYTGPTVFGENASGLSKDVYGINTRSLFGNYAEYVGKAARSELTDEEYDALSPKQKQKVDFYRAQDKRYKQTQKQVLDDQMKKDKFYGAQGKSDPTDISRSGASGRRPGSGSGPTTQDTAASQGLSPGDPGAGTGGYSYDEGGREGFGYGLKKGGLVSIL